MDDVRGLYLKYNPIIVFVLRPILRLTDAHNHPLRAGVATATASGLVHYGIVLPFYWQGDGLVSSLTSIPMVIHTLFGINILSNLIIGVRKHLNRIRVA